MDGRLGIFHPIGEFSLAYESNKATVTGYADWKGNLVKFTYETSENISKNELFDKVTLTANRLISNWNEQTKNFELPDDKATFTLKKLVKAEVKNEIKAWRKEMDPFAIRFKKLMKQLTSPHQNPEQAKRLEAEKQELLEKINRIAQIRALHYVDFDVGVFRDTLLVRTLNKYMHRLNEVLSEDVLKEYYREIAQLKKENPDNPALLKALENLNELTILDFQEGFCASICDSFTGQLEQKKDLTIEDVVQAAKQFEKGVEDPKHVARQVLKGKLNQLAGLRDYVTSKKKKMEPYSPIRKFDNLFLKSEGVKQKKIHMAKTEGLVIPTDLKPGVYSMTIAIIKKPTDFINPMKKKTIIHALAFVKIDDKTSFLLDPNVGLLRCGDAKQTIEQAAKLTSYYDDFGYHTSRLQTRISYTVKL